MNTNSNVEVNSTTVSVVNSVREVSTMLSIDLTKLLTIYDVAYEFDRESLLQDIALMLLNSVTEHIRVEFFREQKLLLSYSYVVSDSALSSKGKPAGQIDLYRMPPDVTVRVVVIPNAALPQEYVSTWLQRLKWVPASELDTPEVGISEELGTFQSQGWGVVRSVWRNPSLERAIASVKTAKEYRK